MVITVSSVSVTRAGIIGFDRCITFVKKLDSRIRNSCDGSVSISSYATDVICNRFSNNPDVIGVTIHIPKAEAAATTLC